MTRMMRLSATATLPPLVASRYRPRWLDNVARRRLRGGGRVLSKPGILGFQFRDPRFSGATALAINCCTSSSVNDRDMPPS